MKRTMYIYIYFIFIISAKDNRNKTISRSYVIMCYTDSKVIRKLWINM